MKQIQKNSMYLSLTCWALLIIIPLGVIIKWMFFAPKPYIVSDLVDPTNASWPPMLRLLGFCASMVGQVPVLISLFVLEALFKNYQNGEVFSATNAIYYRRLGFLFLLDAFFIQALSETLQVLAATLTNAPGHRYLFVSFGTPNLVSLFYGVVVIVISSVMLEASKIYEESNLTV